MRSSITAIEGHHPNLAALEISGAGGLRGIHALTLSFDRPITAICGPSGVGKSTLLELCALAFRAKGSPAPDQLNTAFDQQFVTIADEALFSDFTVTWSYRGDTPPPVTLRGVDRSLSADRPERPVIFISTARMAPARHQPQLAAQVLSGLPGTETKPLLKNYLSRLGDVLQKRYRAARWRESASIGLAICETSVPYSAFNMSFAEENLIEIFRQLQAAGTGSLVIIEDIDAGLHPTTCERLARNLVEMCREKSLQIILSARSPEFLDALPRQFPTLIEFDGSRHYVADNVPMRRVLRAIGASAPADMLVFCEDDIAEAIILQTVDGELRRRMKIVRAGAKSSLAQFAYSHYRSGWGYKILIVWDGDVKEAEAAAWLRGLNMANEEQQALSRIQLPGPLPPERWLIDQLLQHDGASLLAEELGEDVREAQMMLNALTATAQHHNIFYELARKSELDKARVLNSAIRATKRLPHRPLAHLGEQMTRVAAGESLIDVGKLHERRRMISEALLEEWTLALFREVGYSYVAGSALTPEADSAERADFSEVVLAGRFRAALTRLNPDLPADALHDAFLQVTQPQSGALVTSNRAFHRMLVAGVLVEYQRPDGSVAGERVRLIDYDDPTANDWLVVNQFVVRGAGQVRRPDVVIFVNGLPLAAIELKNPADADATTWEAFNQLQTYKDQIPDLFVYNTVLVISDGVDARIGSLTANFERFLPWRTIEGETLAPGVTL